MHITASFKGKSKEWHTIKPDADNIEKACLDAMSGIVYLDDAQVCCKSFHKIKDLQECVAIFVEPLPVIYELNEKGN